MVLQDFQARLGALMVSMRDALHTGAKRPSDDVITGLALLEAEVRQAMAEMREPALLSEIAQGIAALRETIADPGIMSMMAQSLSAPPDARPAVFKAIEDGDVDAVRALLPGYEINAQHGQYRVSALYHAMSAMFGVSVEIIELLLDAGADPRIGIGDQNVLSGLAFGRCDGIAPEDLARVIRRCVDLGADLEQRSDRLLWTPLICAANEWNPVAVEALLLAGADITAKAGEVDGVFGAGDDSFFHANGSPETLAVLMRYARRN